MVAYSEPGESGGRAGGDGEDGNGGEHGGEEGGEGSIGGEGGIAGGIGGEGGEDGGTDGANGLHSHFFSAPGDGSAPPLRAAALHSMLPPVASVHGDHRPHVRVA